MWSSPPGVWLPNHSMEFHTPCGEEGVLPARCVSFLMLIAPVFCMYVNIMFIFSLIDLFFRKLLIGR